MEEYKTGKESNAVSQCVHIVKSTLWIYVTELLTVLRFGVQSQNTECAWKITAPKIVMVNCDQRHKIWILPEVECVILIKFAKFKMQP